MDTITNISVLDGRYKGITSSLSTLFSEFGLIKYRVKVEVEWLLFLSDLLDELTLSDAEKEKIKAVSKGFNIESAHRVKQIEATTNHDVKAVEYYIKQKLDESGLSRIKEWVHFACTSEDINNTAYGLMLFDGREVLTQEADKILTQLETKAKEWKSIPMMSRTHGQPASPTTVGKEFVVFASRIKRELTSIKNSEIAVKMNGATGNFNAHATIFPNIDWIDASAKFISEQLHLTPLLLTTQINPYNTISELLHAMIRFSATLIDLDRDMWGYISFGYFSQKLKKGEIGSSTMPHKVNPINFENSEGNLGIANSLMEHLAVKLLTSRFQRDLTDSTVLRNLGSIFGYILIALANTLKGLDKLNLNEATILADLEKNPELLAEPIQTMMRVYGEENPYERLKEMTRGKRITLEETREFIKTLTKIPAEERARLAALTPARYIGVAEELVDRYFG